MDGGVMTKHDALVVGQHVWIESGPYVSPACAENGRRNHERIH